MTFLGVVSPCVHRAPRRKVGEWNIYFTQSCSEVTVFPVAAMSKAANKRNSLLPDSCVIDIKCY